MDWPQYGFDAAHRGASPEALPAKLAVRWVLDLPALEPAWPDQPRLDFDAAYQPLVVGSRVILASPAEDWVAAYDLATGSLRWRFIAGGPIRLAPASDGGRIFAGSDDGWLYALGAEHGKVLWKFKAAPRSRLILGNGRLIDTWCVRGGPVVADGHVYFAAGIWPLMGIFLHCLDAATGKPVWSNSGEGEPLMTHPHGAPSFGGIAPQGTLAVSGRHLLVPGGRTLPACYDRFTGKREHFLLAGKAGHHSVSADEGRYFCDGAAYALSDGKPLGAAPSRAVFCGHTHYGLTISAGERLYAGAQGSIAAFDLPLKADRSPVWHIPVEGTVAALAAGNEHLLAVTHQRRIYCLGAGAAPTIHATAHASPLPAATMRQRAEALLRDSGVAAGYALVLGADHAELARALAARDGLHVIVLEPDAAKAQLLRTALVGMGLYGKHVAVCVGNLVSLALPPYLASLVVAEDPADLPADSAWCERLVRVLHPYHGRAYCRLSQPQRQALERYAASGVQGKIAVSDALGAVRIVRSGGLPGAGNWTHEHADAANTRVSADTLVKAPLGLLWFGGSSHEGILPRHGHGPQPQVLDGRLVIERIDGLRSIDIYTGHVLWEAAVPGLGAYYNNTSHQFGANGTNTNYVSTPEALYVRYFRECLRLDPANGKPLPSIPLPDGAGASTPVGDGAIWGYLNVSGPYLIGGIATADRQSNAYRWARIGLNRKPAGSTAGQPGAGVATVEAPQAIESQSIFVIDRRTGKLLWSAAAKGRFRHNAVCAGGGRLYVIDRPVANAGLLLGDGQALSLAARVVAFDLATGKILWSKEHDVFGTWLSYSATRDVLLESGYCTADNLPGEPRGMRAYGAGDGRELWHDQHVAGPPLIHGDWVLRSQGACGLLDGKPIQVKDPLTGTPRTWTWTRAHGCNTPAGSQHLLTFRSGAAGYYDLARLGGTGNFGGFRSSCTNNLIVAGGVLTAADYTRTCTCSYQNQTSLALYPDPDAEMWTYQGFPAQSPEPVRRLGVNLGAPGNRIDSHGTLWLECPRIVDAPAAVSEGLFPQIHLTPEPTPDTLFRLHSSMVSGPLAWVCASGAMGVQSVRVTLGRHSGQSRPYTVRLYFAEPEDLRPGDRPFSVSLQGKEVLAALDVAKEAGGPRRSLVKQFANIAVDDQLVLALKPCSRRPAILSGLEVIGTEDPSQNILAHATH